MCPLHQGSREVEVLSQHRHLETIVEGPLCHVRVAVKLLLYDLQNPHDLLDRILRVSRQCWNRLVQALVFPVQLVAPGPRTPTQAARLATADKVEVSLECRLPLVGDTLRVHVVDTKFLACNYLLRGNEDLPLAGLDPTPVHVGLATVVETSSQPIDPAVGVDVRRPRDGVRFEHAQCSLLPVSAVAICQRPEGVLASGMHVLQSRPYQSLLCIATLGCCLCQLSCPQQE
mmetsp:Transcript_80824/g.262075  ORF Transcript_80824/g.262075 Transcript_80824/m.262075 type:complete len:230 (+) Transcript_80824:403-1092(+)